jgi:hypothetical protein
MNETGGSIELTLFRANDAPESALLGQFIGDADNAASSMSKLGKKKRFWGALLSGAGKGVKQAQSAYDVCKPLLENIAIFVKIVDEISEVIYPLYHCTMPNCPCHQDSCICKNSLDGTIASLKGKFYIIDYLLILKIILDHHSSEREG